MTSGTPKPQIDTSKPHPARLYDYFLGGKDNYPVDRELAEKLAKGAQRGAQINREFMHRAVAWAARSGFDQFLDIGTGIPTQPNLHQIVQKIVPSARIVYADNDPVVLRHAEALLISTDEGATDYVETDVRQLLQRSSNTPAVSWTSTGPSRCRSSRSCTSSGTTTIPTESPGPSSTPCRRAVS